MVVHEQNKRSQRRTPTQPQSMVIVYKQFGYLISCSRLVLVPDATLALARWSYGGWRVKDRTGTLSRKAYRGPSKFLLRIAEREVEIPTLKYGGYLGLFFLYSNSRVHSKILWFLLPHRTSTQTNPTLPEHTQHFFWS